jgi:hypothetical protein
MGLKTMHNLTTCSTCGANLSGRWERLTPGIVRSLIKMWLVVVANDRNSVHVSTECGFTTTEYNNFQKLRYFGLVAKTGVSGYWLITRRGGRFIHGRETVNERLLIFRNHIKDRSDTRVSIYQVLQQDTPTWPQREDYFAEPVIDLEAQQGLFA